MNFMDLLERSVLGFIAFMVFLTGIIIGGTVALVDMYGRYQCDNYSRITGTATQWVAMDTCYLKTKSVWVRYDEYLARSVTNEK